MMTATFNGGTTMDLEKTLYFNNNDRGDNDSFERNDTHTGMNLKTELNKSSLLHNKKLEELVIDENQLNINSNEASLDI